MSVNKPTKQKIQFTVNGKKHSVQALPFARLLDVLRQDLGLTGSKEGCGEGECGACSVFLDGKMVNSCIVPMFQMQNKSVTTVEGIADDAKLHKVQQAFIEEGGAQCGICTPGMIIAAVDLLLKNKRPNQTDIQTAISGNLCRCTGYTKIVTAIEKAAEVLNS